jgi:hypothetical protein
MINVLYVAGFTRSGSTILDRLLGQAANLHSLGEVRNIWNRGFVKDELCGCGLRFNECPFWKEVAAACRVPADTAERVRIAARASALDRMRNLPLLLATKPSSPIFPRGDHVNRLLSLYRAISDVTQSDSLVESSKQASYAALLTSVPGLRVHVIHLVRESRAVAYSWLRTMQRLDGGREGELMPIVSPERSAIRWMYHNLGVELLRRRAASHTLVRYEDLVARPEPTLRTILRRTKTPVSDSIEFLDSAVAKLRVDHTVSGNPARIQSGPARLAVDDEWRWAMRPGDARIVSLLTLPLLKRYGYRRSVAS